MFLQLQTGWFLTAKILSCRTQDCAYSCDLTGI